MYMEYLFALYLVAIAVIIFIGVMAVASVARNGKKINDVKRIADLQQWEYLRSLKKDGLE